MFLKSYGSDGEVLKTRHIIRVVAAEEKYPGVYDPDTFVVQTEDAKQAILGLDYLDRYHPGWQGLLVPLRDNAFFCPKCEKFTVTTPQVRNQWITVVQCHCGHAMYIPS